MVHNGKDLTRFPGIGEPLAVLGLDRIVAHARESRRFFEIKSRPDRLDLSADNARLASKGGVLIAVSTDAHGMGELDTVRYGIEQARRAGLDKTRLFNCQPSLRSSTALTKRITNALQVTVANPTHRDLREIFSLAFLILRVHITSGRNHTLFLGDTDITKVVTAKCVSNG